jgi:hypothetical protein
VDLTSNDAGPAAAIRMCLLGAGSTRSYCFYGIGTILGGFANTRAWAPERVCGGAGRVPP